MRLPVLALFALPLLADNLLDPARLIRVVPERMKEAVARQEVPGVVSLVVTREGVIHHSATGFADAARKQPLATDGIFWIASMTKPITATAVMMMKEEGKLSIDDEVAKYIPELGALKTADGQPARITIKQLLTHTSGMGEATDAEAKAARTLADLIPAFASKPLTSAPGTKWRYCQSGINTLGRIVEVVSGQSLPEFMEARLFKPMGMVDTTFYPTPAQMPRVVTPAKLEQGKLVDAPWAFLYGRSPTDRERYPLANGGLFSTAADYARFAQMILNGGRLGQKRYVSEESVRLMSTIATGDLVTGFTPGNGWGLGWCVVRQPQGITALLSAGTFGHGGAYGTQAWLDPQRGVAIILMVQRSNFANSDASDIRKLLQDTVLTTAKPGGLSQ